VPGSTPIVRLECGTAIAVGKHVQRACRLIGEILRDPQIQRNKKLEAELYLTIDALRKKVLAPVYRQHHDLRGQDLAAANTAPPGGPDGLDVDSRPFKERSASKQMGRATALYLHRSLTRIQTRLARTFGKLSCGDESDRECLKTLTFRQRSILLVTHRFEPPATLAS
jgi:hypothetical protein